MAPVLPRSEPIVPCWYWDDLLMTYQEKLLDPRWQKRKSEIYQRDNFTCQDCGSQSKTLHAHHLWYQPKKDPWDYPDIALLTLCDDCHKSRHDNELVFDQLIRGNLTCARLRELVGLALKNDGDVLWSAFNVLIFSLQHPEITHMFHETAVRKGSQN